MHPEVGYIFLLNGFAANYLRLFYNRKKWRSQWIFHHKRITSMENQWI